jgi:two-component system, cell cycle sensor histidine kinase and response regulator CckA
MRPGRYVMLAVSDTGMGMTPAARAHIFEPFFTTKGLGKGTGLGLATVHGIVKQSGGQVEVYSEPNVGTTFKIYLPAVDAPAPRGGREIAEGTLHGQETMLLVEDEERVRRVAVLVLESHGYRVLESRDGKEGLAAAKAHGGSIDILAADVIMPERDGRQLAEALRRRFPALKILFMSGYTEDAVIRHGILRAEVAFLQTPYTPMSLLKKVREVLEQCAPPTAA